MSQDAASDFEIVTAEDAAVFAAAAIATIEDLRDLLALETALLRKAMFRDASALSERKAGLVGSYARYMMTAKTSGSRLRDVAPDAVTRLIAAHDALAEAAAENLPAVERARDTTFRLVKGISNLVEKTRSGPTVYGPGATAARAKPLSTTSLSLDRAI